MYPETKSLVFFVVCGNLAIAMSYVLFKKGKNMGENGLDSKSHVHLARQKLECDFRIHNLLALYLTS